MQNELNLTLKINAERNGFTGEVKASEQEVKQLGKSLDDTQKDLQRTTTAHQQAAQKIQYHTKSAAELKAAQRNLPAQFTDIFVSLQAGQNPMTVFLQQGGQLKDMFGGVGAATKAMAGYIGSLINPYTLAAGAVAGLAAAYYSGSREIQNYNAQLIATNNYAGVTANQLNTMAREMDLANGTQRAAAKTLADVVGTGQFVGDQIQTIASAAIAMKSATGKAIEDTVDEFGKLEKGPSKALIELNERYHFLTAATYEQIAVLEREGNSRAAAQLAIKTYSDTLQERASQSVENLGAIEKAWRGIKWATSEAVDALMDVGRIKTANAELAELQEKLAGLEPGKRYRGGVSHAQVLARINVIKEEMRLEEEKARLASESQQAEESRIKQLEEESKKHEQLSQRGKQRLAQLQQQAQLQGQNSALSAVTYDIEHGQLQGINEQLKAQLITQAKLLDQQNAKQEALAQQRQAEQQLEAMRRSAALGGDATHTQRINYDLQHGSLGKVDGAMQSEMRDAARVLDQQAAQEKIASMQNSWLTEQEIQAQQYQTQLDQLNEFHRQGYLSWEEYYRLTQQAGEDFNQRRSQSERQAQSQMLTSMAGLFDGLAGLAYNNQGKQSKAFKVMFAMSKGFSIADSLLKLSQASMQAMADPSATTLPQKMANYAAVAAAGLGVVQNLQNVNYVGQAHEGISRTHKEGSWWLDKGERVYTNQSANQLDQMYAVIMQMAAALQNIPSGQGQSTANAPAKMVINLIENTSKAGEVTQERGLNGEDVINIVVSQIRQGGPVGDAFENTYNLERVGNR